jgi:Mn-containing catalase
MFRHTDHLQFDAKPEKPDPVYAHKLLEMIATMVARLLEGAPATATTKAALADPVVGAVLGGMDPHTLHQNLWLKAIEELQTDGLEPTPIAMDNDILEGPHITHLNRGNATGPAGR